MRRSHLLFGVALMIAGFCSVWVGSTFFHNHSNQATSYVVIYPPMGPCSEGFSFEYPGDAVAGPYKACDIKGLAMSKDIQLPCPVGMIFSANLSGCTLDAEHQPWRYGPRGYCSLNDIHACHIWQQEATPIAAG